MEKNRLTWGNAKAAEMHVPVATWPQNLDALDLTNTLLPRTDAELVLANLTPEKPSVPQLCESAVELLDTIGQPATVNNVRAMVTPQAVRLGKDFDYLYARLGRPINTDGNGKALPSVIFSKHPGDFPVIVTPNGRFSENYFDERTAAYKQGIYLITEDLERGGYRGDLPGVVDMVTELIPQLKTAAEKAREKEAERRRKAREEAVKSFGDGHTTDSFDPPDIFTSPTDSVAAKLQDELLTGDAARQAEQLEAERDAAQHEAGTQSSNKAAYLRIGRKLVAASAALFLSIAAGDAAFKSLPLHPEKIGDNFERNIEHPSKSFDDISQLLNPDTEVTSGKANLKYADLTDPQYCTTNGICQPAQEYTKVAVTPLPKHEWVTGIRNVGGLAMSQKELTDAFNALARTNNSQLQIIGMPVSHDSLVAPTGIPRCTTTGNFSGSDSVLASSAEVSKSVKIRLTGDNKIEVCGLHDTPTDLSGTLFILDVKN